MRNKYNNPINSKLLKTIMEERLSMQSTQRKLDTYKIKNYKLSYFETQEFSEIFNSWDDTKKTNFLKDISGEYWKLASNIIGKNKI